MNIHFVGENQSKLLRMNKDGQALVQAAPGRPKGPLIPVNGHSLTSVFATKLESAEISGQYRPTQVPAKYQKLIQP